MRTVWPSNLAWSFQNPLSKAAVLPPNQQDVVRSSQRAALYSPSLLTQLAPPKAKYVEPLLAGLRHTDDLRAIMSCISRRLDDSAYSVVFKLSLIHI